MRPYTYEEEMRVWMNGYSGRDDTTPTAVTELDNALAVVKRAGYRVNAPKTPKHNHRVGPTFVAKFADGTVTRMSVFSSLTELDWGRGERLSRAAYQSRWRTQYRKRNGKPCPVDPVPPAIVSMRFEQDGQVLARRNGGPAPTRSAP